MFYRFKSFSNSPRLKPVKKIKPSVPPGVNSDVSFPSGEYRKLFERFNVPECQCCEFYKAPIVAGWRAPEELIVNLKLDRMLDIFQYGEIIYVSESARQVIERIDQGVHQFLPVRVVTKSGLELKDQAYYTLNIRRHIKVTGVLPREDENYAKRQYLMIEKEKERLLGIEHHPNIMTCLETFPLWRPLDLELVFYLNEDLLTAVHKAGLTGFDRYTRHSGVKEQTVCPIYSAE